MHRGRVTTALRGEQSAIVLVDDLEQGLEVVNAYGAEHLEIQTVGAAELAERVTSAGAIFVGAYSPVSLGDYMAGSNHVLPDRRLRALHQRPRGALVPARRAGDRVRRRRARARSRTRSSRSRTPKDSLRTARRCGPDSDIHRARTVPTAPTREPCDLRPRREDSL